MGKRVWVIIFIFVLLSGCIIQKAETEQASSAENELGEKTTRTNSNTEPVENFTDNQIKQQEIKEDLDVKIRNVMEKEYGKGTNNFGEFVAGVKTRLKTDEKVIALTLDACGGEYGSEYDKDLLEYFVTNNIKANLFINARWIDAQPEVFHDLASNPLFSIENHGTEHLPLSVKTKSAWGITSTGSKEEIVNEIVGNQKKILELTGQFPRFFRSGTAYYDETAVKIAEDLGVKVVNFDINGDGGATFSKEQVAESMLSAKPGSIIILHMNQPDSETAEGVKEAISHLALNGYQFVHLLDYELE